MTFLTFPGEVSHVSNIGGSVEDIEKAIEGLPIAKGKEEEEEEEGDVEDKDTEKVNQDMTCDVSFLRITKACKAITSELGYYSY